MVQIGRKINLHFHSKHSDGAFSVAELLASLKQYGYSAGALTDHDHIGGIAAGLRLAQEGGIEFVPGIELSSQYQDFKEVHILGYYFDHKNNLFREKLGWFQESRKTRGKRILDNINKELDRKGNPSINYEEIASGLKGSFGRPHIAQKLLDLGYVNSMEEAFYKYLVPFNAPKAFFPPREAIELIHQAKGLAVLAHPKYLTESWNKQQEFIELLVSWGLDGLEVYYPDMTLNEISHLLGLARKQGLLITGGCDYHGPSFGHGPQLGARSLYVPYLCLEELKKAFFRRNRTLIIMQGLPASGKSYVAEALAKKYNFSHFITDEIRQELFQGKEAAGYRKEIKYSREASILVYSKMWEKACKQLSNGQPVIVDGTFLLKESRQKFYFLASKLNATFAVIKCLCPEEVIEKRLLRRRAEPDPYSEANFDIYLKMKENVENGPRHIFGDPLSDRFSGKKVSALDFHTDVWEESGSKEESIDLLAHELIVSILASGC